MAPPRLFGTGPQSHVCYCPEVDAGTGCQVVASHIIFSFPQESIVDSSIMQGGCLRPLPAIFLYYKRLRVGFDTELFPESSPSEYCYPYSIWYSM